jgi:tRNA threonylcarbamoyladenosine biosynthesis protein TsaE
MKVSLQLHSLDACRDMACRLADQIATHQTACLPLAIGLVGTLGAGKTQWTKFFAQALGAHPQEVSSPTYVLVHRYGARPAIYHVDAYRVKDEDEFLELGIEELFDAQQITIVEWADRFRDLMPDKTIWITFELDPNDPSCRLVTIENLPSSLSLDE